MIRFIQSMEWDINSNNHGFILLTYFLHIFLGNSGFVNPNQETQMKSTLSLLVLALFTSLSVQAMQPESDAGPELSEIISQFQLDAEQADRLTELVRQHHSEMRAKHQQHKQERIQMQQMREQHREKLLTVLNYEQLYRFELYMHEMRRQHQPRDRKEQAQE